MNFHLHPRLPTFLQKKISGTLRCCVYMDRNLCFGQVYLCVFVAWSSLSDIKPLSKPSINAVGILWICVGKTGLLIKRAICHDIFLHSDTRLNPLRLQPFSSLGNSIALRKIFTILLYIFLELRWTVFSIWILGLQHGEKVWRRYDWVSSVRRSKKGKRYSTCLSLGLPSFV